MKAEGWKIKGLLFEMSGSTLNSIPFILPPSAFILAFHGAS
jgi:hypothetical protein